ncbi:MAG: DNA repair protein RadC [Patescibacteria group bacterium]
MNSLRSPYILSENSLTLTESERTYTLTIRDLPNEEKPRERLLAVGPRGLSAPELLAVVLSSGTKKEEVLTMATRIMQDYGERSIMRQTSAKQLSEDLDIPIVKAMQIVALTELGRRFHSTNAMGAPTLRTARDVFEYAIEMRTLPKEHLRGLYLNTHYKLVRDEVISIGTVDANMVHPREVFRPALEYASAAVILVHNHPSGVTDASTPDIAVTEQLIAAGALLGIELVDHVIVTKNGFKSVPASYRI